eukprot:9168199-Pyramimonas_sp.AAC.1
MEDGGEEDEEKMIPSPYARPHLGEVRKEGNSQEEQVTMLGIAALLRQELTPVHSIEKLENMLKNLESSRPAAAAPPQGAVQHAATDKRHITAVIGNLD